MKKIPSEVPLQLGVPVLGRRRDFLAQLAATAGLAAAGPAAALAEPAPAVRARALRRLVRGSVVAQGEAAWPQWCEGMVWQGRKPDRRPPLIVQAQSETDVIEAVRFARRSGLRVGVRTGGHSVWASFMRDEGLLIDLSRLTRLSLDREQRTAIVQPALWGYHLIERAAPEGLAFPVAHCSQVGLGGYLIGGGLGLNHDSWGHMACFSILGADMVNARGELISVDAKRNPDLLWAMRGAGQGFPGIVTKLHLQMQTRPSQVRRHMYVLPLQRAGEVVAWIEQILGDAAPAVEVLLLLAHGPSGQPITVVAVTAFAASLDEAAASLAPFAASELGRAAVFKAENTESTMEKVLMDSVNPLTGFGYGASAVDVIWTSRTAEAVTAAAAHMHKASSPMSHVVVAFKSRSELPADAAFSRADRAFVGLYSAWVDPARNADHIAWLRDASRALQPFASGGYINEVDVEASPQKARDCFSPAAWERLAAVRQRHDPARLFHGFLGLD